VTHTLAKNREFSRKFSDSDSVILVPTAIFSDRNLSFSESLIDFLWAGSNLAPSKIGKLLSMDRRNVFTIMQRIAEKKKQKTTVPEPKENIFIPVDVFSERKFSVQEQLVAYLKEEKQLSNKEIALIISRSEKTVWTAYDRMKKKRGERK